MGKRQEVSGSRPKAEGPENGAQEYCQLQADLDRLDSSDLVHAGVQSAREGRRVTIRRHPQTSKAVSTRT